MWSRQRLLKNYPSPNCKAGWTPTARRDNGPCVGHALVWTKAGSPGGNEESESRQGLPGEGKTISRGG